MTENHATDHVDYPLDKRRIGIFLLFAFGIAWTLYGIIYFTANTGASFTLTTAGSSLGSSDFNALNDFNLTLQGGWNGLTGAGAVISGQTSFGSNTLTIGTSSINSLAILSLST